MRWSSQAYASKHDADLVTCSSSLDTFIPHLKIFYMPDYTTFIV